MIDACLESHRLTFTDISGYSKTSPKALSARPVWAPGPHTVDDEEWVEKVRSEGERGGMVEMDAAGWMGGSVMGEGMCREAIG